MIREACGEDFVIVTPGVRVDEKKDDQKKDHHAEGGRRKGGHVYRPRQDGNGGQEPPGAFGRDH